MAWFQPRRTADHGRGIAFYTGTLDNHLSARDTRSMVGENDALTISSATGADLL